VFVDCDGNGYLFATERYRVELTLPVSGIVKLFTVVRSPPTGSSSTVRITNVADVPLSGPLTHDRRYIEPAAMATVPRTAYAVVGVSAPAMRHSG
jgi:hypothetical protein